MRIATFFIAAALLSLPARMSAQGAGAGGGGGAGVTATVLPGDASIDGAAVQAGTAVYRMTLSASGKQTNMGTLTVHTWKDNVRGTDVWRVAHTIVSNEGNTVDTITVAMKTIAPISLRGATPAGTMTLDYDGVKVTGEHRDPEGSAQAIQQTLSNAAFDPNALDQLLASMPLRAGYNVRVPMFMNETGMVLFSIKIEGDAAGVVEPAWNVSVTTPEGVYHYSLSKANRSNIGVVFDDGNRMRITMQPLSQTH